MSNAGQAVSAIGGAVIGWSVGGPTGALYGFQAGMLIGSQIFPTELPHVYGPRLDDFTGTTSALGAPIPYLYGRDAVTGNVIYLGPPVEQSETHESGGKGGSTTQKTTTYSYTQTIAVSLAEGVIGGVQRIWENGAVVYDVRPQLDGESADAYAARVASSGNYETTFTFYPGSETQNADPTIESEVGLGNVPAFRGLSYIVFHNRQLKEDQGLRHPSFKFEIYKSATNDPGILRLTVTGGTAWYFQSNTLAANWERGIGVADCSSDPDNYANATLIKFRLSDMVEIARKDVDALYSLVLDLAIDANGDVWVAHDDGVAIHDGSTLELIYNWAAPIYSSLITTHKMPVYGSADSVIMAFALNQSGTQLYYWTSTSTAQNYIALASSNACFCIGQHWEGMVEVIVQSQSAAVDGLMTIERIRFNVSLNGFGQIEIDIEPRTSQYMIAQLQASDINAGYNKFVQFNNHISYLEKYDEFMIGTAMQLNSGASKDFYFRIDYSGNIAWVTGPSEIHSAIYTGGMPDTRITGNRFFRIHATANFFELNLDNGDVSSFDMAPYISGHQPDEAQIYNSLTNSILAYGDGLPSMFYLERNSIESAQLSDIVSDVWARCGGDASDITTTDLSGIDVLGYTTTRPMPGRGAVEELRKIGFFDAIESQGKLKFVTRGKPAVRTLTSDDIGVTDSSAQSAQPAIVSAITSERELPQSVRVKYRSLDRDYENGEKISQSRFTAATVTNSDVEISTVITDTAAKNAATKLWADAWAGKASFEFALDIGHIDLDAGDALIIPFNGRNIRVRIVSISDADGGLIRKISAISDDDGSYSTTEVADPPARPVTSLTLYSGTSLILLDLPMLRDQDNNAGIYAAAYPDDTGKKWTGCNVYRSSDGGSTWDLTTSINGAATAGILTASVGSASPNVFDYKNTITVSMQSGTLSSATEAQLLESGANAMAIGAHGRWEVIQFSTATLVSAGVYSLTGLLRGRRGTEHNIGTSVSGDHAVYLNSGISRVLTQLSDIGAVVYFRAPAYGSSFVDSDTVSITTQGETLKPFSPVNVTGSRDGSNNLTIGFTRRGRIGYEMTSGTDIPLSEESESYSVDIMNGSDVLRTIATTTQTASYTAAQQTTDGLTPGDPVTVRVFQISATVGRGHYYSEATI